MRNVCRALDLTLIAARDGSRAAVSDAGDAAVFCRASLQGASLNVLINTKMMKDRRLADEYNAAVADMLHKYIPVADNIYSRVLEQLSDR
jgi:formiminotetrahydrofolate cyclodeaminase